MPFDPPDPQNPTPLPSPTPTPTPTGFDVEGARKAGASDEDIAQHLAQTRNFDYAGATKAGASPQDIIEHLRNTSAPPTAPKPQAPLDPNRAVFSARSTAHPITNFLEDALSDVEQGTSLTPLGKLADFFQGRKQPGQRAGMNVQPLGSVGDFAVAGPLHMAHAISKTAQIPTNQETKDLVAAPLGQQVNAALRPPLELTRGAMQTALPTTVFAPGGPIAASALPTIAATGAGKLTDVFGASPEVKEATQDIVGGIVGAKQFGEPSSASARDQENAFNALHPKNNSADTPSVLPEIRNAASEIAAEKPANPITSSLGARPKIAVPKGKAGIRTIEDVTQRAIDNHEAQIKPIKDNFPNEQVDNSSAGAAARAHITPEMRVAASNGDARATAQIQSIEEIAQRAEGANTVSLTDNLRHTWNDELHGDYAKSPAAQDVAPAVTQAQRSALNTLRGNFYNRLGELSGQDLSPLAQREGLLMEAKSGLRKSGNAALERGAQNDKTTLGRALTGSDRSAGGVSSVAPAKASALTVPWNIIKAIADPTFGTPVGDYTARVVRSLKDLPPARDIPIPAFPGGRLPIQQSLPLTPTIEGPLFEGQGGTSGNKTPYFSTPAPESTLPASPNNAAGTTEHVPSNFQSEGGVLPNNQGRVVPRQLTAPQPKGLLPAPGGSSGAIALPAKSQSTLQGSRSFETPAANEDVLPSLIRDFLEHRPSKLPSVSGGSGDNAKTIDAHGNETVLPPEVAAAIPPSSKVGGAKILLGDVPLTGPASPAGYDLTRLQAELKTTSDPAERANIQQAIENAQARLDRSKPIKPRPKG